jgi:hypothetical protein
MSNTGFGFELPKAKYQFPSAQLINFYLNVIVQQFLLHGSRCHIARKKSASFAWNVVEAIR